MTSFSTCARAGCDARVEYDRKKDTYRPRYCKKCEEAIEDRLRATRQCTKDDIKETLLIKVIR